MQFTDCKCCMQLAKLYYFLCFVLFFFFCYYTKLQKKKKKNSHLHALFFHNFLFLPTKRSKTKWEGLTVIKIYLGKNNLYDLQIHFKIVRAHKYNKQKTIKLRDIH
jgi:predicted permease